MPARVEARECKLDATIEKFRLANEQIEMYSQNLERMVEQRTAELPI